MDDDATRARRRDASASERHTTYLDKARPAFTTKPNGASKAVSHPTAPRPETLLSPRDKNGFALVTQERGVRRIFAVDAAAAGFGLFVGQKAADAQALAPDARLADADPDADARAVRRLADVAERFSPAVAVEGTDSLVLDITGLAHLWGGEANLVVDLVAWFSRLGFKARCAVAGTPGAAWALAHFGEPGTIAPPGGEADALFPLPVTALRLEAAVAGQIARLGLVTIGRLAALPSAALTRRFGPRWVFDWTRRWAGRVRRFISAVRPPRGSSG